MRRGFARIGVNAAIGGVAGWLASQLFVQFRTKGLSSHPSWRVPANWRG
jgi:hypothetical protein